MAKANTNRVAESARHAANEIGHARLEWPDEGYQRLKSVSTRSNGLIVTAYISGSPFSVSFVSMR